MQLSMIQSNEAALLTIGYMFLRLPEINGWKYSFMREYKC